MTADRNLKYFGSDVVREQEANPVSIPRIRVFSE
jgi:hypothetical protein